MAGTLEGKVAIVTGAGRGIGRAMTLGLLGAGASVVAVEIDAPVLEETESAADERGSRDRLIGIVADVTRDESAPKIVRAAVERESGIMVAHLAIEAGNLSRANIGRIGDDQFEWTREPLAPIADVDRRAFGQAQRC